MIIAVWKVWGETHVLDELAFGLGHRGQNLYTLVRRYEPMLFHVLVALAPSRRSNFEY